jgi:hypothetical protein
MIGPQRILNLEIDDLSIQVRGHLYYTAKPDHDENNWLGQLARPKGVSVVSPVISLFSGRIQDAVSALF